MRKYTGAFMPIFDHFNLFAPYYDRFIRSKNVDEFVKIVGLPIEGTLLDAGGGTGRIAEKLTKLVSTVIIADSSYRMLLQAASKGDMLPLCTLTENLPFDDESFERIIMVDALHHVYCQTHTVAELWRVVKRGGKIVIEEPDIRDPSVWVVAILEKIGLMRSHFISPKRIANLFKNSSAKVTVNKYGHNAWIVIEKKSN